MIGSIAGAAIASAGFNVLNYGGFTKIIMALVFSPLLAICAGFIMMTLFKLWFKNLNLYRTNKGFRTMQILLPPSNRSPMVQMMRKSDGDYDDGVNRWWLAHWR